MASGIEWTQETWSPVTGCTKVSQGCKNCYAEREVETRWNKNPRSIWYGRKFTDVQCHPDQLDKPLRMRKGKRIFVCPRADLFHDAVPDEFIDKVFAVMALCGQHKFQVLTKRPARMMEYVNRLGKSAKIIDDAARSLGYTFEFKGQHLIDWPIPNIWLGVSVEDQAAADERIPLLLQTPAVVRWISVEPMLGAIDLFCLDDYILKPKWRNEPGTYNSLEGKWAASINDPDFENRTVETDLTKLDWVVCGGESGPNARPLHPAWARSLRDQCAAAGTPYNFKQWGEWAPERDEHVHFGEFHDGTDWVDGCMCDAGEGLMYRIGKKRAGRLLGGVLHDEYPRGT